MNVKWEVSTDAASSLTDAGVVVAKKVVVVFDLSTAAPGGWALGVAVTKGWEVLHWLAAGAPEDLALSVEPVLIGWQLLCWLTEGAPVEWALCVSVNVLGMLHPLFTGAPIEWAHCWAFSRYVMSVAPV